MSGLELLFALTHHGVDGDFNERHPGLRYENNGYMGSLYHNSEGNPSLAAGLINRKELGDLADLFIEYGLATGYSAAPVVPMGRAGVEFGRRDDQGNRGAGQRLFVFPAVNKEGDANAGLGFEVFKRW